MIKSSHNKTIKKNIKRIDKKYKNILNLNPKSNKNLF